MDTNQRRKFVEYAGYAYHESFEIGGKLVPKPRFVLENPKLALWQTGIFILGVIYITKETEDYRRQAEEFARKVFRLKSGIDKQRI